MTSAQRRSSAEPFFLKSEAGQCFCLYHRPDGVCHGTVLYIHPFAEEMNRSRRMAALQARELAALGYGVLQLDLLGCGDSSGDFGDARWDLWKRNIAAGTAWLRQQLDQPVILWGLRLGALLALDYASDAPDAVKALLLWQPTLNGSAYLTQFLRLRMASALLADTATAQTGTGPLRDALRAGETLEIAGYDLAPELTAAIDAFDRPEAMAPDYPVYWLEAVGSSGQALPPAVARITAAWREQGVRLEVHPVQCPPFWTTPEITVCQAWLTATSAVLQASAHDR